MNFFVIIRGPLGCGKTTIAKQLTKTIKAKYFSIDDILEQNKLNNQTAKDGYISEEAFLAVNKILIPTAEQWLKKDQPIIIDGNFYRKIQINDLIDKLKYPHFVFTLTAPLEICIERDNKRKQPYGIDAVKAVYKKTTQFNYGIEIDATMSKNEIISEILTHISDTAK